MIVVELNTLNPNLYDPLVINCALKKHLLCNIVYNKLALRLSCFFKSEYSIYNLTHTCYMK